MAISSRLALWEQKESYSRGWIREEDKSPPPSSPPPLFSVIPGGFIRQLVRETEKESKEARRKKQAVLTSPEPETPEASTCPTNSQPCSTSRSGSTPIPKDNEPSTSQNLNIPGKENEGAAPSDPAPRTSLDGEKSPEVGSSGPPAKKPMPLKRGPRRGDVLLMVAKLDPDSAKPEQRTPQDEPKSKPSPPATDPGGERKGSPPQTPQNKTETPTPKTEKTQTGTYGKPSTVPLTSKDEKEQGTVGKGGAISQTKGPKGGEPQGREGPDEGGQAGSAVKDGGASPNKLAKESVPKDAGGKEKKTGVQVQVQKGVGSLGRKSLKDRLLSQKDREGKAGKPQLATEAGVIPKGCGKVGEPPSVHEKPPGEPIKVEAALSECPVTGQAGSEMETGREPPTEVLAREESPGDSGKTSHPDSPGQGAPVPFPATQLEPPIETALEGPTQGPADQMETPEARGSDQPSEDRWYEAEKVWLVQKDGFTLATVLKPDEGTADLPAGRVRLCIDADKTTTEVDEEHVHRANPPELDQAEDLASLVSVNESSVLNTLLQRYRTQRPHTRAGSDLIILRPWGLPVSSADKVPRLPTHLGSLAHRAYWALMSQRKDQSIVALGRSGAGKTACCEQVLEQLVVLAGSVDGRVSVEKLQAMFTVLRAFGSVTTGHSHSATRFAMVMSLDFSASGRVTAAQLQTMLLEQSRVARQPDSEGNFQVFSQMLAGLDLDLRTELNLHQLAASSSFGMGTWPKSEDKQKAAAAFAQLQAAMETLGISESERRALWRVLAAIYHLGAAGACKVGRKQFMRFEWANHAAEALGCEYEELNTATFKHHLRQIIQQVTSGSSQRMSPEQETSSGLKMTGTECVEGMAAGLYQEVFAAVVSLINRSFSSPHLSMASIMVVDAPGFQNPRHQGKERAATFEELCCNYTQERLQLLCYQRTFGSTLQRFQEEGIPVNFEPPETSPGTSVAVVDQNPPQTPRPTGGSAKDSAGLFWVLDEEVRVDGSSDAVVLERLRVAFEKMGVGVEGTSAFRTCEQPLQFEISHQLGQDPVRYDLTGWLHRAKPNLSALDAPHILQHSKREELRNLFQCRAKLPPVCRALAGLEGTSQQALQRGCTLRRTFARSLAAVKRRAACSQVQLQMDALTNVLRRSQLHFIHCLVPGPQSSGDTTGPPPADIPALRIQLAGAHILEALRLHRAGYADHMGLAQFRRHFQTLDPLLMKKLDSASETMPERKAVELLLQSLDLEKTAIAVGHSQVFLKAGVVSRLEKQREKLVAQSIAFFQAACRGFLARQEFKKLKIHRLAAQCIRKNLAVFLAIKDWPWWQLLAFLRPLLSATIGDEQLHAKEEELTVLRLKLEKSEKSRNELRQNVDLLESKIADLTTELADERFKGDVSCQVLETEHAERLRASRELQEVKSKYEQVQKSLGEVEKQLEEAQQKIQLSDAERKQVGGADEWQMRFDCAQMENEFLRKRLQQFEERLDSELTSRKELEQKLAELQSAYEAAKKTAQQLKRKCHHVSCDLEDSRVLLESQQARNHELEKKQKKFDMKLAQALGESVFEKRLREKVIQENASIRWELGKLQLQLKQKEEETSQLKQDMKVLQTQKQELLVTPSSGDSCIKNLKEKIWKLECSALEQGKIQNQQENTIEQLQQLRQRFELEIERMKQIHQKDREDREEELEDVRQSCQKRLRQLEMQLEQEYEQKQLVLHEKQDLEGLIGTLCDQIGHRDFDVEKRLRRDLRRTHALLSDVQLLLATMEDGKASVSKEELEKVHSQLELSEAKCEDALKTQKTLTADLESMHSELESMTRSKSLVDEQLYRLQFERADLLKRIDEDQDDLNDLMQKHKDLISKSATDIGQIQELQLHLEEAKKEKHKLQEQLQVAQMRIEYLEKSTVDRSIVSRQEAIICDLENKTEFQKVQIKRLEALVIRLRDNLIKMGEELSQASLMETQQRESNQYYQRRLEELKADMEELLQREAEANQRYMVLEKYVEELGAVRQTLQADLETSIRRIADLQAALEDVVSSDSEAESVQTAVDCGDSGRKEIDNMSTLSSQPEGSVQSWRSCTLSLDTDTMRTPSRLSYLSRHSPAPAPSRKLVKEEIGTAQSRARKVRTSSPVSRSRDPSPQGREQLPSPSAALSEFVEGLRKKRAQSGRGSALSLEDWPSPPVYHITGAASLRRARAAGDQQVGLSRRDPTAESPLTPGLASGLLRSSSLRCLPQESSEDPPPLDSQTTKKTRFGSCEGLLESGPGPTCCVPGPDLVLSPTLRPRRRCLEASLDEAGCPDLGKEPLVFQNRQFAHFMEEPPDGRDTSSFSWKLPGLSYDRHTRVAFDDFIPAIRKPGSPSSVTGQASQQQQQQQQAQAPAETEQAKSSFLSGFKALWKWSREPREDDPAHLSDSSSSACSIASCKSSPRMPRMEGDGGERRSPEAREHPAGAQAGKDEDVESIMKKYLGK
ncbi:unconventional myosin-XVIIIb [Suncus etruscus]|uniref:unconventional myosin-XVIIIb n=1 Tax=Suncus etruscus TaxID=109475 RepID=UPI00210F5E7D|nr:unconventional myosin-XVIIIb [Suncus etruscus]